MVDLEETRFGRTGWEALGGREGWAEGHWADKGTEAAAVTVKRVEDRGGKEKDAKVFLAEAEMEGKGDSQRCRQKDWWGRAKGRGGGGGLPGVRRTRKESSIG